MMHAASPGPAHEGGNHSFKRTDELVWIKTNQVQKLIRSGRTGHWLNHCKEHCLVGIKGQPAGANRGLDCDVLVSEVREMSQKPDEIYALIERLSPGTRKIGAKLRMRAGPGRGRGQGPAGVQADVRRLT